MSPWAWVGVALLGGCGAVLRFLVDDAISRRSRSELPVGTLAVNLTGSVALGALAVTLSGVALVLAGTATVGAYTTFSTWMLESQRLGEEGQGTRALANLAVSLLLGLGAVALGRLAAGRL